MKLLLQLAVLALLGGIPSQSAAIPFDHLKTKDDIGPNKIPHSGTSRILVIPSRVGPGAYPADRWAELSRLYAADAGEGSFRRYWQIVSNGKYDPIPTLVKPVLFPDSCPVPGKQVADCRFTPSVEGVLALIDGSVAVGIKKILERVRDEQGLDLRQFDLNSGAGQQPDGYFDGVILDTDIYQGIALPLAAVQTEVSVPASSPTDPQLLRLGIIALVPPDHHEFAHLFGLIDLYGGPEVNDLQGYSGDATPSAFTRQQLGWSQVVKVTGPGTHLLKPTLDGGSLLRLGDWGGRYLLLENRGGQHHNQLGSDGAAGLYLYSIDESTLPTWDLGFLDLSGGALLYLPNSKPPYLCINLPLDCAMAGSAASPCALRSVGDQRRLQHVMGEDTGLLVQLDSIGNEGQIGLSILAAPPLDGGVGPDSSLDGGTSDARPRRDHRGQDTAPEPGAGCGCGIAASPAPWLAWLLLLPGLALWWRGRSRSGPLRRGRGGLS